MATRLPDGSVVARPSGSRAYPVGGGTTVRRPSVAAGGGSGAKGKRVGVSTKQPGRSATGRDAYK